MAERVEAQDLSSLEEELYQEPIEVSEPVETPELEPEVEAAEEDVEAEGYGY